MPKTKGVVSGKGVANVTRIDLARDPEIPPISEGVELAPWLQPEVGDWVEKVGYVDLLRINEAWYLPEVEGDDADAYATRILEGRTYCIVQISSKVSASEDVWAFRILYSAPELKGEKLAISMSVVAALREAMINRTKVAVRGELNQLEVVFPKGYKLGKTELFNVLKSVDLVRS
jgi:hypothetical protein